MLAVSVGRNLPGDTNPLDTVSQVIKPVKCGKFLRVTSCELFAYRPKKEVKCHADFRLLWLPLFGDILEL